jgi:hypothetical protein
MIFLIGLVAAYLLGVVYVGYELFMALTEDEDEVTLAQVFSGLLLASMSWSVFVIYVADKADEIVVWRRKKE